MKNRSECFQQTKKLMDQADREEDPFKALRLEIRANTHATLASIGDLVRLRNADSLLPKG